jgi:hypothetical protein
LEGLVAGKYTALITDSKNCYALFVAEVKEPMPLEAKFSILAPQCLNNCNGSVKALITGGTLPYTLTWKDLLTQETELKNLCAGSTQQLTVKDNNNCTVVIGNTMPSLQALLPTLPKEKTVCANSKIWLEGNTGNAKTYEWILPNGNRVDTKDVITDLLGVYRLNVSDANNCMFSTEMTLKKGSNNAPALLFTTPTTVGINEPFVMVNLMNPLPTVSNWVLPSSAKVVKASNLQAELSLTQVGNYALGLNAQLQGCEAYRENKVRVIGSNISIGNNALSKTITIVKIGTNPSNGKFSVLFDGQTEGDFELEVIDQANGQIIHKQLGNIRAKDEVKVDLGPVKPAQYLVIIKIQNETYSRKISVIN